MYCSCKDKKLMKNSAHGSVFNVCAKSLGGCGKEIGVFEYQVSGTIFKKDSFQPPKNNTMPIKAEDLFIKFLKDNNCLDTFESNLGSLSIKDLFNVFTPTSVLSHSFIWHGSKEGDRFWRNLHNKWINLLTQHENSGMIIS